MIKIYATLLGLFLSTSAYAITEKQAKDMGYQGLMIEGTAAATYQTISGVKNWQGWLIEDNADECKAVKIVDHYIITSCKVLFGFTGTGKSENVVFAVVNEPIRQEAVRFDDGLIGNPVDKGFFVIDGMHEFMTNKGYTRSLYVLKYVGDALSVDAPTQPKQ